MPLIPIWNGERGAERGRLRGMDRVSLYRAFVRVADTGSVSRAARALGTTQPTVSKWLRQLETRLGQPLVFRSTRGVRLTDAGQMFLESARRVVGEVEQLEAVVRGAKAGAGVSGLLRFSFPLGLGAAHLAQMAFELQAKHPALKVEVALTDRAVDLVQDQVDLTVRLGGVYNPSVIARPLGALAFVLVATPGYLEERGAPRAPADLTAHDYLQYGEVRVEELLGPRGIARVPVRTGVVIRDHLTLRAAALAGRGVARAQQWLVKDDLDAGRLRVVLPGWEPPPFVAHAVYLPVRPLPERVRAGLNHLAARIKEVPGWRPGEQRA